MLVHLSQEPIFKILDNKTFKLLEYINIESKGLKSGYYLKERDLCFLGVSGDKDREDSKLVDFDLLTY